MEPMVARKTWRTVEPIHVIVYFAPEQAEVYGPMGLRPDEQYFVPRAAPMGAVSAGVVEATFFNFHPSFVRSGVPADVWDRVSPATAVAGRLDVADRALRRLLGDAVASPETAEAASLARTAAEAACGSLAGRPIFAANAGLDWPDADVPHLVLWHAQTLLREFRGDNHIAALVAADVDGCAALVLHAAMGEIPRIGLQVTRRWSDEEWDGTVERLRSRGWLDGDGAFTDAGRAAREQIEAQTDALSVAPYAALGDDGCDRLRTLARPLSKAIVASGELFTMTRS